MHFRLLFIVKLVKFVACCSEMKNEVWKKTHQNWEGRKYRTIELCWRFFLFFLSDLLTRWWWFFYDEKCRGNLRIEIAFTCVWEISFWRKQTLKCQFHFTFSINHSCNNVEILDNVHNFLFSFSYFWGVKWHQQ